VVDFDALIIKQQIAEAPMNIEVARRKEFIDSKEGKVRGQRANPVDPGVSQALADAAEPTPAIEPAEAPTTSVKKTK
jgi:hypothetical protein